MGLQMKLGWNRSEDGVITIYGHLGTGRVFDVADLWLRPLMAATGANRDGALRKQQEFAEFFVAAWNASGRAEIFADDGETPYFYTPDEDDIPGTARRFVEIPPSRGDMTGKNGCWLGIAGCKGNCGSYGCGG